MKWSGWREAPSSHRRSPRTRCGSRRRFAAPISSRGVAFKAPGPAHRRMAIADVDCVAIRPHALGISRGTGENQVVAGKDRAKGEPADRAENRGGSTRRIPGSFCIQDVLTGTPKARGHAFRQSDSGMKVGAGKHAHQLFGDLFGATELGEVIVDYSNLHGQSPKLDSAGSPEYAGSVWARIFRSRAERPIVDVSKIERDPLVEAQGAARGTCQLPVIPGRTLKRRIN
jgi:hypothetical protein